MSLISEFDKLVLMSQETKTESFEDVVRRTQRDYSAASSALLEQKDLLVTVLSKLKDAQDATLRAHVAFSAAKEQHMASIIQQQNDQLKTSQTRPDNVAQRPESQAVVVDMKGQPFSMPTDK